MITSLIPTIYEFPKLSSTNPSTFIDLLQLRSELWMKGGKPSSPTYAQLNNERKAAKMATLAFSFDCVPQAATLNADLSNNGYRIYTAFLTYKNRKTGRCNPKETTLAAKLGKSLRTIERAIAELRSRGMVLIQRTLTGNRYEVTTPDQWRAPKMAGAHPPNMAEGNRQNWRVQGAVSIYEPDVFEPEVNRAAAVKPSDPVKSRASAAAAPPPPVEKKTEHPAAPPVGRREAEQLGLDMQETDTVRARADALVEELHATHPQPGLPDKAIDEAERILRACEDVDASVEMIRQNHAAWKAHWEMLRPGKFIPQLWRWFHDGEWRRMVGKPIRQENFYEREQRKWDGEENAEYRQFVQEYDAEQLRKRYGKTG